MTTEAERQQKRERQRQIEAARQATSTATMIGDVPPPGWVDVPGRPGWKAPPEIAPKYAKPEPTPKPTPKPSPEPPPEPPPPPESVTKVVIPPEAVKVETTAEGRPAVYEKDRERYYAPASTMYQMGFRTSDEYRKAQQYGASYGPHSGTLVPKDSVLVQYKGEKLRYSASDVGKHRPRVALSAIKKGTYQVAVTKVDTLGHTHEVFITSEGANKLAKLEGRALFDERIKLGLIPTGSRFIPGVGDKPPEFLLPSEWEAKKADIRFGVDNTQLPDGQWISKKDLAAIKKESPELHTILTTKGFNAYTAEIDRISKDVAFFEKTHVKLPDGQWINKTSLIDLKHEAPDLYKIITTKGYAAYEAEATKRQETFEIASTQLESHMTKEGTNIAKYLRDNPYPASTTTLKDAGFTDKDIKEAQEFNKEYLGVGLPERPTLKVFTEQYFNKRGWKLGLPHEDEKEIEQYYAHATESKKAYDREFAPTLTVAQFNRNYFDDKGWEYDVHLGVASDKERLEYSQRLRESSSAYTKKFGAGAVVSQGFENLGDMVVPGLYLAKNWETMSSTEKKVIIAIDAAFLAVIFNKPLTAGLRQVVRTMLTDEITGAMKSLQVAIRSGNSTGIRAAAVRVAQAGVKADQALVPIGRQATKMFQQRALDIAKRAEYLAGTKGLTDKQITDYVNSIIRSADFQARYPAAAGGLNWNEMAQKAMVRAEEARGLVKTAVRPITRQEAKSLGLSEADIERIFSKAGENREAFLKEARALKANRDKMWRELQTEIDKLKKPEKPDFGKIAEPTPGWRDDFYREVARSLKNKYPKIDPGVIDDAIQKAIKPGATLQSAMIYIQAKINEAVINHAVKSANEFVAKTTVDRTLIHLNNEGLLLPAIAGDPALASRLIQQSHPVTRAKAMAGLSEALRGAIMAGRLADAQSLAKAATKTLAKTDTKTMAKIVTKGITKVTTKAIAKVTTKAITKTVIKPVTKVVTRAAIKPLLRIPVKPALAKPVPTKPVPTKPVPKVPPPPILPSGEDSDKEKRKRIKKSKGAVTYNMGKLKIKGVLKDCWHVRFDTGEHIVVLGKVPEGAVEVDGPGSAYKTARRLGDRRSFPEFSQQHGIARATLTPSDIPRGAEISFSLDRRRKLIIVDNPEKPLWYTVTTPHPTKQGVRVYKQDALPQGSSDTGWRASESAGKRQAAILKSVQNKAEIAEILKVLSETGRDETIRKAASEDTQFFSMGAKAQRIGGKRDFTEFIRSRSPGLRPSGIPKGVDIRFRPTRAAPKPKQPKSPSVRVGRQYFTKMGDSIAISRRPLGRRGRRR